MAALAKERDTPSKHKDYVSEVQVKASTTVWSGGLVSREVGTNKAKPATDTANEQVLGRAGKTVVQTASSTDRVPIDTGIYAYATTGGSALDGTDVGKLAYVLDDQTVVRAAGTVNSVIAGRVVEYESASKVWIDTRVKA